MAAEQVVALEGGPVACIGALDFDRTPTGISPRRLPDWTRPQMPDLMMNAMVGMGSGVRLAFATDSDEVELDVMVTGFRIAGNPRRPAVFQLVTGGRTIDAPAASMHCFVLDFLDPSNDSFEPGEPTTIRFEGLGTNNDTVEIWLPHAATTELRALRVAAGATVTATPPSTRRRWLHYGSSISHCMEADTPTETWPAIAARLGDVQLFSLGLAGQCHLDGFVARTIRDQPADLISLKLGINIVNGDTMRERTFVPAVHAFLDTIRDGHPDTPVLVVSPIFCPSAEDTPGPTFMSPDGGFDTVSSGGPELQRIREGCLTLRRIRELLAGVVEARRAQGDEQLAYLDGLELFGEADAADLPDRLHPNNAGYARMGQRFAAVVFGVVTDTNRTQS